MELSARVAALRAQASACNARHDSAGAIAAYRRAICLAARPPLRDPRQAASLKVELSIVCLGADRRAWAWRLIGSAIRVLSAVPGAEQDLARARNTLGTLLSSEARHREAACAFAGAVQLMEAYGGSGPDDLALGWRNLGIAQSALHKPQQAVVSLRKALAVPASPAEHATARYSLANAYCSLSQYGTAAALYLELLEHADEAWQPRLLDSLATLRERTGELAAAQSLHDQAVAALGRPGADRDVLALVLINAADFALSLGDRASARRLLDKARRWTRAGGLSELSYLSMAAGMRLARGHVRKALADYRRAASIAAVVAGPTSSAVLAMRRCVVDLEWPADPSAAYSELQAALDTCDADSGDAQPAIARATLGMMAFDLGRVDEARAFARASLLDEVAMGVAELRWRVLLLFGRVEAAGRRMAAASLLGKMAVEALCQLGADHAAAGGSGQAYRQQRSPAFHQLADWLVRCDRIPEAYQVHQAGLADELFDSLQRSEDRRPRAAAIPLSAAEEVLSCGFEAAIGALGRDATLEPTAAARDRERRLGAWLDDVESESWIPSSPGAPALLDATDADAGPGTGLLRYMQHGGGYRLAVRIGTCTRLLELPGSLAELRQLCFALRKGIAAWDAGVAEVARRLHERLIAPAAPFLAGLRALRIVPDGSLRYVPFAALTDGTRFLVEQHALSVVSGVVASRGRRRPRSGWLAVGLGDTNLQHAQRELEEGVGRLGGRVLLGERFTRPALTEALHAKAGLLHVASHFVVDQARAGRSRLLLGDGSTMLLDEFRAPGLDLSHVELLVLSACDTGLEVQDEQGLSSLAGVFTQLGARSVLATQWPVEDAAAADLMQGFYQEAFPPSRKRQVSLAEALRRAQLRLLAVPQAGTAVRGGLGAEPPPSAQPYSWAGYTLFGDPN